MKNVEDNPTETGRIKTGRRTEAFEGRKRQQKSIKTEIPLKRERGSN